MTWTTETAAARLAEIKRTVAGEADAVSALRAEGVPFDMAVDAAWRLANKKAPTTRHEVAAWDRGFERRRTGW